MRFQVPQFIEIEDQIFGPLTFRQFIYIAGGGGLSFLAYRFLPFFLAVMAIVPIMGLSLALAFYRVNNRPFIHAMESAVKFFFQKKLYIWKKEHRKKEPGKGKGEGKIAVSGLPIPRLSDSKLKELSWSLDIADSLYASYDKEHKSTSR